MVAPRIAPFALALLLATRIAHAQDSAAAPARYLLGIGVNASTLPYAMPSLELGREWRAPTSRFGLRLTGDLTATDNSHPYYPGYYIDGTAGTSRTTTRDYTLGIAATYALTRGRIQPYLISGFVFQVRDIRNEYVADPAVPVTFGRPNTSISYRDAGGGFGMQGGIGLSARVGGATLFTEARALVPMNRAIGLATSTPLTIGLRF